MAKVLILLFFCFIAAGQNVYAAGMDERIEKYFSPIANGFYGIIFSPVYIFNNEIPFLYLFIIIASIFFTIYFKGINVWGFKHALSKILVKKNTDDASGEVSSLGALATALSGTIGIGNIAGVAIAISWGGPGAMFWMCLGAVFGMVIKFCEVTLSLKYRRFNHDGSVSGGPMYYIERGFARRKYHALGKTLSYMFAIALIPGTISGGCMLQSNQATRQFINITGGNTSFFASHSWLFGLIIAVIIALVIVGGIKSIVKVTSKIVPSMCLIYILACSAVIIMNITQIPHAIYTIIHDAFLPQSVYGGITGTVIIGLRRSLQSNEAGVGSSPIAYAAVKTNEPASQGFISMLEPFFDTVIVCSMTAFVIILTGEYLKHPCSIQGVELTSSAFESVIPFFPYILAVVIILFALSTIISWAYYGQKAWSFLAGEGKKRKIVFNIVFCLFIVIGSCMDIESVANFTDATYLLLAFINIIAIFVLIKDVKKELIKYRKNHNF